MKCHELKTKITELLNAKLPESRRSEALAHVAACKECRGLLESERRLTAELQALAAEHAAEQAPFRIQQQLVSSFRSQTSVQAGFAVRARVKARKSWIWGAAAAGVVLGVMIVGSVAHRTHPTHRTHRTMVSPVMTLNQRQSGVPIRAKSETPPPDNRPVGTPDVRAMQENARTVARSHPRPPKTQPAAIRGTLHPDVVEAEVATDFYAIPYVEPVRPEESLRVVRTRVPRSSLVVFGYPVNGERASEPIQADVLVGEDNVAHAIRFVQPWRWPITADQPARLAPVNEHSFR